MPDFRCLATKSSRIRFTKTQLKLLDQRRFARARRIDDPALSAANKLAFLFIDARDTNAVRRRAKHLLSEQVHCPVEALYQIYGEFDLVVELSGSEAEVQGGMRVIQEVLNSEGVVERLVPFEVAKAYRHWGVDLPLQRDDHQQAWLINPEPYRAIRALMRSRPAERGHAALVEDLRQELDYVMENGDGFELRAIDMIDRIYFDKSGWCVMGILCACGDYYKLNELTDKVDSIMQSERHHTGNRTYLVAGIPHFSPLRSGLKEGLDDRNVEAAHELTSILRSREAFSLQHFCVVGKYYRWDPKTLRDMRALAERIKRDAVAAPPKITCYLLGGQAGSGKTVFVKQCARSIRGDVVYKRINLVDHDSEAKWKAALDSVTHSDKAYICLLDEIDKRPGEPWVFSSLLDPLVKQDGRKASIVWILAGAEGGSVKELETYIRGQKGGGDVLTRVTVGSGYRFTVPATETGDRLVIGCAKALSEADEQRINIKQVEAKALFYSALGSEHGNPREIESVMENAVRRMSAVEELLKFNHFFDAGDDDARQRFVAKYPSMGNVPDKEIDLSQ